MRAYLSKVIMKHVGVILFKKAVSKGREQPTIKVFKILITYL